MRLLQRTTLLVMLSLWVTAAQAGVPEYPQHRWMIGIDGIGSTLGENEDTSEVTIEEQSSGGGFQLGYMLSSHFQLRLYTSLVEHTTSQDDTNIRLGGGALEAVYLFRAGSSFRPYLSGGVGGYKAESQQDILKYETEGGAVTFGLGAHWHLGKVVAVHFSGRLEAINWDKQRAELTLPGGDTTAVESPIDESGTAGKFTIGLAFWF